MLLVEILCIWVFTTAPAIPALQVHPHPEPLLLSRLDQLEHLAADHQAQFQRERDQWAKEKKVLMENLHLLQADVHGFDREKQEMRREKEVLQNTQILTQTLVAENQDLKTELGELQRQLATMDRRQQSLQDLVTKCEQNPRPDKAGGEEPGEEDKQTPGEQFAQATQTADHQGGSQDGKGPSPQYLKDRDSTHHHAEAARSDDQGPLDVVINHLAQQTTQLSADLQALKTQVSQDSQALKTQLTADIQALKTSEAQQHDDIQAARGSTFVRWGSSTCTSSAELVYSGVMGGSYYTHTGAAANALCLTLSPRLLSTSSGIAYTLLFGGQYETDDSHDHMDTVCAVCRPLQPTTIMVPGTNVCSTGWTRQYSGFLMAGYHSHHAATQFICVDDKMESVIGSSADNNGHLLYYTKTQCGSLPCPPYVDNKVVTCAVCSK